LLIGQPLMLIFYLVGFNIPTPISLGFLGLMFIDWFIQYINLLPSSNPRRLITGLLAGAGLCNLYILAFTYLLSLFP